MAATRLKVRQVNLVKAGAIPVNTAVLAIASPQHDLLPGEVNSIRAHVKQGGSLLWADDPGRRCGLTPLAQDLGIHWLDGTLVYPDFRKLGTGSPAMALVANYPDTPITANLKQITVFAFAFAGGYRDFMGNGPLSDLGNRTLVLAMFQWLAGRDAQIAADVPKAPARISTFGWVFVVGTPGALFGFGVARWWWQRRP